MTNPVTRPPSRQQDRYAFPVVFGSAFFASASCLITVDTNANMADGNVVTVDDGFRKVTYEYDKSANGVTAGNVNWGVGGGTAAQSAATLKTAINLAQTGITVTDNTNGTLTLTHKWPGAGGNAAGNTCTSVGTLAITAWSGGAGGSGVAATTTVKEWKIADRPFRLRRASINVPGGFTQDAANYWTVAIKNGSTVMASWSTLTGSNGTLTADTPSDLVLGTNADAVVGDTVSIVLTKTGSPANFPLATLMVEGKDL